MQAHKKSIVFLLIILLAPPGYAWQGKCVGVTDGDDITVKHDGRPEKVRLYGVDTPEYEQDFGSKARQFTSDFASGRNVIVEPVTTDSYGRTVAIVYTKDTCLNEQLVKNGFAWVYKRYCDRDICVKWQVLERSARSRGLGLWADPNPMPPWQFKHRKRSAPEKRTKAGLSAGSFHGNTSSRVFHRSRCRHFNCKSCTAVFSTREEAAGAGYRACKTCRP